VFQCDLDAVLDQHSGAHDATCCGHDHGSEPCTQEHAHAPLEPALTPLPFAPPKRNP
jgi:hypothetical protein